MSWRIIGEFVLGGPPGEEHVASQPASLVNENQPPLQMTVMMFLESSGQ